MNSGYGNLRVLGIPDPPMPSTNTFIQKIHELEDKKINLVLRGAFYLPELRLQMEVIDKKLQKYYRWYARAWMAGKV